MANGVILVLHLSIKDYECMTHATCGKLETIKKLAMRQGYQ